MGLLDLPAPLFAALDAALAPWLPAPARLAIWAVLGAAASVGGYRLLAPQARITAARHTATQARRALHGYDGDFAGAAPLLRAQLAASLRELGLVLPATLLAALPLLALLVWIETAYGHAYPPAGVAPAIRTVPAGLDARWTGGAAPHVLISRSGTPLADVAFMRPVPTVHKRRWWNLLAGNPAGYLPAQGVLESVTVDLPAQQHLYAGPSWARTWAGIFIPVLTAVSLALYWLTRRRRRGA